MNVFKGFKGSVMDVRTVQMILGVGGWPSRAQNPEMVPKVCEIVVGDL